MPRVVLAAPLARWMRTDSSSEPGETGFLVEGACVGEALESLFVAQPSLRGYVLDDQGALRRHVAVFVDGIAVRDKARLDQPVSAQAEIRIMQALSGG